MPRRPESPAGRTALGVLLALLLVADAHPARRCRDYARIKNAYFGDLHTHTSYSLDAYTFGTRTDPAASYAFATGAAVNIGEGYDATQGEVPGPAGYTLNFSGGRLDFAAVTDHSEFLSAGYGCTVDTASPFYAGSYCTRLRALRSPPRAQIPCVAGTDVTGTGCSAEQRTAWAALTQATEAANDPCTFTTFHAYEWTYGTTSDGDRQTLHKNVFFRNANVPPVPVDAATFPTGPRLWAELASRCNATTGCEALTIPHNMNQSNAQAFNLDGYTATDLNRLLKFQRLVEIHQHKGSSECLTDTADTGAVTACDFEVVPTFALPQDTGGYARQGLEQGLARFATRGYDPHLVGFVGATDNHDGTPGAVGESSYVGHIGSNDNTPARRLTGGRRFNNPGGVTGVWAEENTREAIWAALERRETFATSGPKLRVRFYQYTRPTDPCADPRFPASLVKRGAVPMGGIMTDPGAPPRFVVYAVKDETPLAAVDVVKASFVDGAPVERVFTLPLATEPSCVTWTDPAFDSAEPAFYYARVREQPTWRWSHYDCEALKAAQPADWQTVAPGCGPAGDLDVMVQERAWTSSIWYLPGGPVTVRATSLRLRDGHPSKRDFRFKSRTRGDRSDRRIVVPARGSAGDPTLLGSSGGGGTLDVYNGESGERVTVALPPERWRAVGGPARYLFADAAGPVQKVLVAPDRLTIRAGGPGWGYTLDEPHQGAVAVRLRLGSAPPWCSEAPARQSGRPPTSAAHDTADEFSGEPKTAAPEQCPLTGSPSGAFVHGG